jgi:hypothetical protein
MHAMRLRTLAVNTISRQHNPKIDPSNIQLTMISSIGPSRNVRLIPSGRDEWTVGLAIASSMSDDDAVKCAPNTDDTSKSDRSPHSLRLDTKRVAYGFCDLYSIPEDESVCEYRSAVREEPLEGEGKPNEVTTNPDAWDSEECHSILFQTLRNERLEHEAKQREAISGDTETGHPEEFQEPCVLGKKRNQAWNSEQFNGIIQVLQDEGLDNDFKENTAAESSIMTK